MRFVKARRLDGTLTCSTVALDMSMSVRRSLRLVQVHKSEVPEGMCALLPVGLREEAISRSGSDALAIYDWALWCADAFSSPAL